MHSSETEPSAHKISRREVLKAGALAAVGGYVVVRESMMIPRLVYETLYSYSNLDRLPVQDPRASELEEKFNVSLTEHGTAKWNNERLSVFDKILSSLRPHFYYLPDNQQLEFMMIENDLKGFYGCVFIPYPKTHIQIREGFLNSNNPLDSYREIVHELAHNVDNNNHHVSWGKINDVFEGNFRKAVPEMRAKLEKPLSPVFVHKQASEDLVRKKLQYGFSRDDPRELVASLSELYPFGRDYFDDTATFLGEDKTEKLHQIIKDDIFKGANYGA